MFNKITSFQIDRNNIEILDNELVKTASEIILPEGHEYDPDFVYMKVRAVSAGEYWGCNKNADFFPEEELKKNYKTFFDAHVFKNHENKEVEKAIGDVLDAVWNDEMKYVELFIRVDKRIAPTIARGFEKGFMTDVSMGCKIDHSICSICGNSAKTQSQYCDHIKYEKHKVRDDGRKVYEININPRFHDISAVLNGADRTAKMTGLFISGTKVAYHEEESLEKCASTLEDALADEFDIEKEAGFINPVGYLNHRIKENKEIKKRKKAEKDKAVEDMLNAELDEVIRRQTANPNNTKVYNLGGNTNSRQPQHQIGTWYVQNHKQASVDLFDFEPLFSKTASTKVTKKASELEKVAEIKKRIKGNILAVAQSRAELAEQERIDEAAKKIVVEQGISPLSEGAMNRFADGINRLSDSEEVMAEQVLTTALKMLSLAGVNLTPHEFIHIMKRVIGIPQVKVVRVCPEHIDRSKVLHDFALNTSINRRFMRNINLPTVFNIIKGIHGKQLSTMGERKAYAPATIIIQKVASCDRVARPEVPGLNLEDKVLKLASEIIEERSLHLPHITKRAMVAECEVEMEKEAEEDLSIIDHYYDFLVDVPAEKVASEHVHEAIERLAYGSYQNLVAEYTDSPEFNGDLYRFANEIGIDNESMEKCAKNIAKSMNAGLGTYLYSQYQNVKAREGRPQSTLNRTMAENPTASAIGATIATKAILDRKPAVQKNVAAAKREVKKAVKGAGRKVLKYMAKTADENIELYLDGELDVVEDNLQDIDIFKDSVITTKMAMEYTPKQIELIKTASIMYAQGRQDLCDNLLSIEGLGYDAVNNFLQVCEDTLFEELEKKASIGKVVGTIAGKATKAIGNLATKAAPAAKKVSAGIKNVGSQVGSAVASNATPGMKNVANKVRAGVKEVKNDISKLSPVGKVGLGMTAVGTGIGVKNSLDNKRKFNEIHQGVTNQQQ